MERSRWAVAGRVTDLLDPESISQEVEARLADVEQRLLALVQDGARRGGELGQVLEGLMDVGVALHHVFVRLQDVHGRRDVGFEVAARLEAVRRRTLWLYRKSRLEQCFFTKLRIERGLRDIIYRHIVETYQDMATLDDAERELRARPDDALADELLREPTDTRTA
jgi:hypothetical protein